MAITLDLSPATGQALIELVARDRVAPTDMAKRLISGALWQQTRRAVLEAEVAKAYAATGETEEELEDYITAIAKTAPALSKQVI